MPLVKFSALVTRMSGKLNGSVFAFNQGGDYFRNNKQGKGKTSVRWQTNKALWAGLSTHWRNLTQVERDEWIAITPLYPTLNRFGVPRTPSGYELYMRLNGAMLMNRLGNALTPDQPEQEDDLGVLTGSATANPAPNGVMWQIVQGAGPAITPLVFTVNGDTILDGTGSSEYDTGQSIAVNQYNLQSLLPNVISLSITEPVAGTFNLTFTFTESSGYWNTLTDLQATQAPWTSTSDEPTIMPPVIILVEFSVPVTAGTVVCGYCGSYQSPGARPRAGLQKWMLNQTNIAVQSLNFSWAFIEQFGQPIAGGTVNGYLRVIRTNTGQQGQKCSWTVTMPV